MNITLPQVFKIVDATGGPVTTNGGVTGLVCNVQNAARVWIVLQYHDAGAGFANVIQPTMGTVIGSAATSITKAARIWYNLDTNITTGSDALAEQTAATAFTTGASTKNKMVIFEINPVDLGSNNFIGFTSSNSSQATNMISGMYFLWEKYEQATPPTTQA